MSAVAGLRALSPSASLRSLSTSAAARKGVSRDQCRGAAGYQTRLLRSLFKDPSPLLGFSCHSLSWHARSFAEKSEIRVQSGGFQLSHVGASFRSVTNPAPLLTVMAASSVSATGAVAAEPKAGAESGPVAGTPMVHLGLKKLEALGWENTFVEELPGDTNTENHVRMVRNSCYTLVRPSLKLNGPELVAASESVAKDCLGLDPSELDRPEFLLVFSGGVVPEGCKPYAQCYGGHQFGHWAGQLGDGRAITLGEVVLKREGEGKGEGEGGEAKEEEKEQRKGEGGEEEGKEGPKKVRWEVQLKGVGRTPYSRMADGRAVLRSSIREYLCSEAMHALGVPTTRALSVISTGEQVLRDMFYNGNAKYEPGAAVCRVAPSFVRFGTFQLPVSRGGIEKDLARVVADYAIRHHFSHLDHLPTPPPPPLGQESEAGTEVLDADAVDVDANKYAAWFAEVAKRTGELVAGWQSVGFTHGVLNTDNMSILGLTIDYGPFGFLDAFDPNYTPNTTDLPGRRYCFQNQPDIGMWNIVQLANALHSAGLVTVPQAQHCVSRYAETFVSEYERRMKSKLGLKSYDKELTQDFLTLLARHKADFTNTFRALSTVQAPAEAGGGSLVSSELNQVLLSAQSATSESSSAGVNEEERRKEWEAWLERYVTKVREECLSDEAWEEQRVSVMHSANPKYILRNYLCQQAIEAAEKGDYSVVRRLQSVLQRPFDEQPGAEEFAMPAPEWAAKPGVCMLSCSS